MFRFVAHKLFLLGERIKEQHENDPTIRNWCCLPVPFMILKHKNLLRQQNQQELDQELWQLPNCFQQYHTKEPEIPHLSITTANK
jgi:hypothetical protein